MIANRAFWACLALALLTPGGRGEDFAQVEKEIMAKYKKIASMKARTVTQTEMDTGEGKTRSKIEATYEYVRKDDKVYMRTESKEHSETETEGKVEKSDSQSIMIADGESMYTHTLGEPTAMKGASSMNIDINPFDYMRAMYDLTLKPDEKFEGHDCWVISAKPKPGEAAQYMSTMVYLYRKDCGIPVRMETLDSKGTRQSLTTYHDLELNAKIDPDRFVFKAPDGVRVMDIAQLQAEAMAEQEADDDEP